MLVLVRLAGRTPRADQPLATRTTGRPSTPASGQGAPRTERKTERPLVNPRNTELARRAMAEALDEVGEETKARTLPRSGGPHAHANSRERRIERDRRHEHVRVALRGAAAAHGMYVFEALMSEEAGQMDFLAVGPDGLTVVVVREDEGDVTDMPPQKLFINDRPFEDDPRRQAWELVDEVNLRFDDRFEVFDVICFTNARLWLCDDEPVQQEQDVSNICTTWGLLNTVAPAEEDSRLTPADVADLADTIRVSYGKPPFAVPKGADLS